ncbi:MAG: hypothetical protein EB067_07920 [Actinobacteria bacterium]|nr:hypothetical protein [Actinomycetota bacterium]
MAGQSRTLKLSILADVDQLKKSLAQANGDVDDSSSKMGDFSKKAGMAFAAAGIAAAAYAVKIGVDGVKAAIEDEQSQTKLALALKNATGATQGQIDATEASILKMSLATGVADDKLRPALSRLAISTGDISKAQDLLSLSLDISTQTGKPLEAVANSLGKAFDGNTAALGKLGIGLSSAELKTMSFNEVQAKLSDLFGGAAAKNADTFQGRLDILKVTLNEAKETIGYALLPILQKLVGYFVEFVVPIVDKVSNAFSNKEGGLGAEIVNIGETLKNTFTPIWNGLVKAFGFVSDAISDNIDKFKSFWEVVKYIAPLVGKLLGTTFSVIGDVAASLIDVFGFVLGAIKPILDFIIDRINNIITIVNFLKPGNDIAKIPKIGSSSGFATGGAPGAIGGGGSSVPKVVIPAVGGGSGGGGSSSSAMGGGVASAVAGVVMVAAGGGFTDSQNAARLAAAGGGGFTDSQNAARINLTVNGAIDAEGTARTIINALNDSYYRGTGGGGNLVAL